MSSEQNKTIVRRLLEEPWKGNLEVVDELIDRNYVGHDPSLPEPLRGPDGFKENISTYRAAYSDARITVDEQIAEGDKVATRWTGRGKHDGDLMGIGPTGKQVTVSGLTLSRLVNGKVIEEYTNWDTFGMMQQLDVVPELAHLLRRATPPSAAQTESEPIDVVGRQPRRPRPRGSPVRVRKRASQTARLRALRARVCYCEFVASITKRLRFQARAARLPQSVVRETTIEGAF